MVFSPSLLQALFPPIELILAFCCPESPRRLIAKGKSEKVFEVLTKYHAGGDIESPLVKFEMAEITAAIEQERSVRQFSWNVWFKSKANLHRLFLVIAVPFFLQLCGSSLVSYYFSIVLENIGYTEPIQKLKINIGLTVYGLVWSMTFAILSGKIKRRVLFITGFSMRVHSLLFGSFWLQLMRPEISKISLLEKLLLSYISSMDFTTCLHQ